MGSRRRGKERIQTQRAVPHVPSVSDMNCHTIHKGGPDWTEQFGTPCSPINVPQDREMHPCAGFHSTDR